MVYRETDILVLSSSYGGGHLRAAQALMEAVSFLDPHKACVLIDFINIH